MKINRIKVIIQTNNGRFGADHSFTEGLNLIGTDGKNTQGKSSIIECMFYALGLEEILSGQNDKALKPSLKSILEYNNVDYNVIESDVYLEIENEKSKNITIRRSIKNSLRDNKLVSVYEGDLDNSLNKDIDYEDMYVHDGGAATNKRGFHKYLEEFLDWQLPMVDTYDGKEVKLYLQALAPVFFTEQKRGWGDLIAPLNHKYKIKESRKKIVEYMLAFDTLELEKEYYALKKREKEAKAQWKDKYVGLYERVTSAGFVLEGIAKNPMTDNPNLKMFKRYDNRLISFATYKEIVENKLRTINEQLECDFDEQIDEINTKRLTKLIEEYNNVEKLIKENKQSLSNLRNDVNVIEERLGIILNDLSDNKDALKISRYGSVKNWSIIKCVCPTCSQTINDSLLPNDIDAKTMSIEENINYLKSQKELFEFSLHNKKKELLDTESLIEEKTIKLSSISKEIRALKSQYITNTSNSSESFIRQKISIEDEIEDMLKLESYVLEVTNYYVELIKEWKLIIEELNEIPSDMYSIEDKKKLTLLRNLYYSYLLKFNFESIKFDKAELDFNNSSYSPAVNGFDIKYDSSASDNIRSIWAYKLALSQIASKDGRHIGFMVFDEPGQQKAINNDVRSLIHELADANVQVIVGITIEDELVIDQADEYGYNLIMLKNKAFRPV
ncbi:AAA family ATPase [Vallitalea pronyensis]|uniref:AAA family ATPase n=1 Tax=Vallitalea pronyensis TaxID=1348613 RepID=A0A8J8SGU0_9FIRM|nr:AAA family ATPase [Vallitalea pronyensis]QUI22739.1 AAA family ATPase [Vallitalea pronyensis]